MQNRYFGDIGDYAKFGLLRALNDLGPIGVAWYLFPDESHTADGKHINYLAQPTQWEGFDPPLYQFLRKSIEQRSRSIHTIEKSNILRNARYSNELLATNASTFRGRAEWRKDWFARTCASLSECEIIFADPDNGLCMNDRFASGRRKDWKRMPLKEAEELANGRSVIVYHHNSRFPGGHRAEILHWMNVLPRCSMALYWRRISNRTFFVMTDRPEIEERIVHFAQRWKPNVDLVPRHVKQK